MNKRNIIVFLIIAILSLSVLFHLRYEANKWQFLFPILEPGIYICQHSSFPIKYRFDSKDINNTLKYEETEKVFYINFLDLNSKEKIKILASEKDFKCSLIDK